MPEYIKAYTWEQWKGDEKFKVPSWKDHTGLEDKLSALQKSMENFASETALKNLEAELEEKMTGIQESLQTLCARLTAALSGGQWKETFAGEIADSLLAIETRYKEINAALDEKMVRLAEAGAIEERVKKIFLEEEKQIQTVIRQEGCRVKAEIEEQLRNAEILDVMKTESQTIRWE